LFLEPVNHDAIQANEQSDTLPTGIGKQLADLAGERPNANRSGDFAKARGVSCILEGQLSSRIGPPSSVISIVH
jgi:hypothetical protein